MQSNGRPQTDSRFKPRSYDSNRSSRGVSLFDTVVATTIEYVKHLSKQLIITTAVSVLKTLADRILKLGDPKTENLLKDQTGTNTSAQPPYNQSSNSYYNNNNAYDHYRNYQNQYNGGGYPPRSPDTSSSFPSVGR